MLVDGGVLWIEGDESSGTIAVALEDGFGGREDTEKDSKLLRNVNQMFVAQEQCKARRAEGLYEATKAFIALLITRRWHVPYLEESQHRDHEEAT